MTSTLASRSLIAALLPIALAAAWPARAHAQPAPTAPQDPYDAEDDADDDAAVQPDDQVGPNAPAPNLQPPAPPSNPPPPQAQQVQPQAQASASGQWVYTQQRGWLWMPYGDQYMYAPPATPGVAVYPYEYVYGPAFGWSWVAAPWVVGWGPRVYFSIGSPRFGWWHRHPFIGHRFSGGHVIRPGFRGGFRGHVGGSHFSGRVGGGHVGGRRR